MLVLTLTLTLMLGVVSTDARALASLASLSSPSRISSRVSSITAESLVVEEASSSDVVKLHIPTTLSPVWNEDYIQAEAFVSGTLLFTLNVTANPMPVLCLNIRQPIVFSFVRAATKEVLAVSQPTQLEDAQRPQQGHLALTGVPGQMTITWVSNATTQPEVRWGSSPLLLLHSAPATGITYTIGDMCAAPANEKQNFLDPGMIYTALLTDLPYGQPVYYQYGSQQGGFSNITKFHVVEPGTLPFNFIAFGDMGVNPGQPPAQLSTLHMLEHIETTDMVVHIGDISYARGHAYIWEDFFHEIQPVATRVPYMTGQGNHEYDFIGQPFAPQWSTYGTDSGGECGVAYKARLPMPTHSSGDLHNRTAYYSFSYGPVHVAMLDSEADFLPGSPQHTWLKTDLSSVNRTQTPFVIVTNHRPLYDSSAGGALPEVQHVRDAYEPLLEQYAVDLVLVGHIHVYQRSCRVLAGKCNDKGPVHMTVGMAGHLAQGPWLDKPEWLQQRSLEHGIALFSVANRTALHVQFQEDASGKIQDEFWIYRQD